MALDWLIVLGAMLAAFGLPFLIWGIHSMISGLTQTRNDVERNATDVRRSLDEQTGNVRELVTSQEQLIERIQHLEAIVTSEAWDTMAKEKQERIADEVLRLDEGHVGEEESDSERAARLARSIDRN